MQILFEFHSLCIQHYYCDICLTVVFCFAHSFNIYFFDFFCDENLSFTSLTPVPFINSFLYITMDLDILFYESKSNYHYFVGSNFLPLTFRNFFELTPEFFEQVSISFWTLFLTSQNVIGVSCIFPAPALELEKAMAPHSSTLAWKIPWTEELGRLQSMGWLSDFIFTSLSHSGEGNGNPLQCSYLENPRDGVTWWAAVSGHTESDTTEGT